jgi:U3 small nucleolar RNA-associated protein 15
MAEYEKIPIIEFERRALAASAESKSWQKFKAHLNIKLPRGTSFLVYSQKKKAYFYGTDITVLTTDLKTFGQNQAYTKERSEIRSFKVRKDGNLAAYSTIDGEVKILSLMHKSILKSFKFSSKPIGSIDLLDKQSLLIAGGDDGSFHAYDFASQMELLKIEKLHKDFLRKAVFANEFGERILTGGFDRKICLLDLRSSPSIVQEFHMDSEIVDLCPVNDNFFISAENREICLWDLRRFEEPVCKISSGVKSLTGTQLIGDKILVSSLDGYMRSYSIEDKNLTLLRQHNYGRPIAGFSAGLIEKSNFKSLAISFVDGTLQILTRSLEEKELENEGDTKLTAQEKLLFKQLSVGYANNDTTSHQYFNRGIWGVPEKFTAKISKPVSPHFQLYDKYLRKFKYTEALEKAIESSNTNIIISVLEELIIRNGLASAVKGLDEPMIKGMLAFVLKKLDSVNCQKIVTYVFEVVIDTIGDKLSGNEKLKQILIKIDNKLTSELHNVERCCFVNSMIESLSGN